jgi:hypothetical protein
MKWLFAAILAIIVLVWDNTIVNFIAIFGGALFAGKYLSDKMNEKKAYVQGGPPYNGKFMQ